MYQYADPKPSDVEDEGRHILMSKLPKRVVEWVSKAWTEFEKELPVFYREALARLLCLEHFRNLIETQALDAGARRRHNCVHGSRSVHICRKPKQ